MAAVTQDRLVFLDLETTGGNASRHRIIEIGLIEARPGKPARNWRSFVDPGCSVPAFIQSYTGIDADMLTGAPSFAKLARELLEILDGAVLVAHNARFDYGFLRNEFRRLGIRYRSPVLCTVKLARALYPGEKSYSLDALIARHGLACEARHRALGDAQAMYDFYRAAMAEHGEHAVATASAPQLRRPSLPAQIDPGLVDRLPNAPGVYQFLDAAGRYLYVGKSVSIRSRVLSHFSSDHAHHKDMRISRQLADIQWEETAGELGALLKESCLVKEKAPVYNRRLRRQNSLFSWRLDRDGEFHKPVLVGESDLRQLDPHENFGLFRSRRAARNALRKLCTAESLCPARCGLEKSEGACFAFQLGRCRGACAGKERHLIHNLRLAATLAGMRIAAWPFPGPIGLREADRLRQREEIHVFDNWCWLGSASEEHQIRQLLADSSRRRFDLDIFRILRSWLDRKQNRSQIICLQQSLQAQTSSA